MMYSLLCVVLLTVAKGQTAGNITYVISTGDVQFQCSNGAWTDFGLSMSVHGFFNGNGPFSPMAETGLPTIDFSWFINGQAATATLVNAFGVTNVVNSGNTVSFDLEDDQPSIGGTFAVGTCTNGQTLPAITVAMSSKSFITGQGFSSPFIPAISGVPNIVNEFPAANNAGGSTGSSAGTGTTTSAPTAAPTHAPTTAATAAPTTSTAAPTTSSTQAGNITYVISASSVQFQCSNGAWTDFGLTLNVGGFFNGVGPSPPMAETGLPTIKFSWFINGAAATATLTNAFNVANVVNSGNTVSFDLKDDQPSIGGTFAVGTCTNGQTQPSITVSMSSNTFITGLGVAPSIPAVSGVPHIVNGFPAANNAGSTAQDDQVVSNFVPATKSSNSVSPAVLAVGLVLGAVAVGGTVLAVVKHKRSRRDEAVPMLAETNNL